MARQTTVTAVPTNLLEGQLSDGFKFNDTNDVVVDQATSIAPGLVILRSSGGDRAGVLPPAVAELVSSIKTAFDSTTGVQNFTTTDFNGSIGSGRISPPAKVELVFNSHANWDATTATLTGLDENGVPISDTIAIPDAGNATVKSSKFFSRVLTLSIPAQSGTGGSATFGTSADVSLDGGDVLGISVHTHKALATPAEDLNEVYEQHMTMPVLKHGRIGVKCENAFRAGDVAMVRVASGTGTQLGAIRAHDADSSTCVPCRRMRFVTSGSAGTVGELEVVAA